VSTQVGPSWRLSRPSHRKALGARRRCHRWVLRNADAALHCNQQALPAPTWRAPRQVDLSYKTLPVTASHFDGTLEYNTHNLYSLYEVVATAAALQRLRNRRQFILTRCARLPARRARAAGRAPGALEAARVGPLRRACLA